MRRWIPAAILLVIGCGDGDEYCDPTQNACGNPPVTAIAGTDREVAPGANVSLDASASNTTNASLAWRQLAGPAVGALSGAGPTFRAPDEVATLVFELTVTRGAETERDTVAVWVLEDPAYSYWVRPSGNDANAGTRAQPFATVQAAIDAAHAAGHRGDVYIAAGEYTGGITVRPGVSVYGGFDPTNWVRDVPAHRPTITGNPAVSGTDDAESLTLDGLRLVAPNATAAGGDAIAAHLHDADDVSIRRNIIVAGNGGAGADRGPGEDGAPGHPGTDGAPWAVCAAGGSRAGGLGGALFLAGGGGGDGHVLFGGRGADGVGSGGGDGGIGGAAVGTSGQPGQPGGIGAFGANGEAGGGVGPSGVLGYTPAAGGDGGAGGHGHGGGGGGGAGGVVTLLQGSVCGGGGGGGGGGGERGGGGRGGGGGGASIGVLLTGTGSVTVADNQITTGAGGRGGDGGRRGAGGSGGQGRSGASIQCYLGEGCTGAGGAGGDGGPGGPGGHGGGGGGGPSLGVARHGTMAVTMSNNEVILGNPGVGGSSLGNAGVTGLSGATVIVH